MKRFLIPTDFTDASIFAISSAAGLAEKLDAEVILLHVLDEPTNADELANEVERVLKMAELKELRYHYKQISGDVVDSIVEQEVDLIVMGSEGAAGLESFFVGTNAEKVAKRAKCPVVVVKTRTDLTKIKKIVFPTNMNREDDEIIEELKFLQLVFGSKVHIVKAFDDTLLAQRDVEKRLTDFAEFHEIKDYAVTAIAGIDEGELILEYAEKEMADLLLLATHDRKGLDRIFAGHISAEVINESSIPIWSKSINVPSL